MNQDRASSFGGDMIRPLEQRVRLLGQPHLQDFLDFMSEKAVDGGRVGVRALTDEWRAANDHYYDLEKSEAGFADEIEMLDLDPACEPLAEALAASPRFRSAFDALPTEIVLVELDRLIVSQQSVSLNHTDTLKAMLGAKPDPEAVFRFCQPQERVEASVSVQRLDVGRYLLTSDSSDFRAHDTMLLGPTQLAALAHVDPVAAGLCVPLGFGSNLLHAIRADDRLVLQNGYHRAYALRDAGVTHAVCVVETVTRRDELKLVASGPVVEAPEFYFKAARPPVLKDFFDPKIRKIIDVRKMRRMIEVKLDVREHQIVE